MKHLVIIGQIFPEPDSTAAGKRILQLIDFFIRHEFRITFLSAANSSQQSFDLSSKNIETHIIQLNDSSFDHLVKKLQPDFVLFDRFMTEEQFGWRISETCSGAIKILDTEDLHFLRKAREKAFKQNRKMENADLISDVFKREIASILRCDLSLIISEYEMNLLKEKFKIDESILHYLPIFVEPNYSSNTFSERKNFISIGNFLHEPNWQTVLQLKKIWPLIRKQIPEAEIHLYGAYPSDKAFQLHQPKEGFHIKGRAENLAETLKKHRIMLAPIPFGAGIKGKLLDAMQFGLPSVTSSIGAEGMNGNLKWSGFIADSEEDFIEKSVQLYQDESSWKKAQENGYRILTERFSKVDFEDSFISKLKEVAANIDEHRNKNFLGQILQHHQLQSTKYMSRWIEEKNHRVNRTNSTD